MKHGSLFSGIGGFELGAQQAGIETIWSCELEEFNRNILKKHFPNTKQYADIREMRNPEYVDIISGGFPCQDISIAGRGEGITGSRSGLWGEYARIISEVNPKYVIIENSPQLLRKGFEKILYDLSEIGYDAEWECLSASDFGAPHKRERVYIIAYSGGKFRTFPFLTQNDGGKIQRERKAKIRGKNRVMLEVAPFLSTVPCQWLDKPNPNRMDDGISTWPYRLKATGNAIVPLIGQYLFECIKQFDASSRT